MKALTASQSTELHPSLLLHSEPISKDSVTIYVDDKWIASRISMKISTIRSQRFKRLHSQDHWLTIDPVYIGNKPRYRLGDIFTWLQK